jgi:dTDP-4-dehydrorhamnose 3,5-epimerase
MGGGICCSNPRNENFIMKFKKARLKGIYIIESEFLKDKRGYFARTFCCKEFKEHALNFKYVQCNVSFNKRKGTVRGLHFQRKPYEEAKLVSCIKGSIYDVVVDLRSKSATYLEWYGIELNAKNNKILYIPKGFAHGFQTLEDNTTIYYQMSEFYQPKSSMGLRWNDPKIGIKWPLKKKMISKKDLNYPFMPEK